MNIDLQLRQIAECLPDHSKLFSILILETLDNIFVSINEKKIAMVCGGIHTQFLKCDFSARLATVDIIDKSPELIKKNEIFETSNVYGYDSIDNYDLLIISSYEFRNDVKKKLISKRYSGRVLDIYEELKRKGIDLSREYYHYKYDPYSLLIIGRKLFIEEHNYSKKEEIFSGIISLFIKNKDILQAKKCINLFLQMNYPDREKYMLILKKLISLEKNIYDLLHQRKQKDILCFWQDDLRYITSKKLPYLNRCREEGIDFINAYGTSISTRSTYGCMMERRDEISLFLHNKSNNQVADLLIKNGYKAFRIGGKEICSKLEAYDYRNVDKLGDYKTPTTVLFWEALKILLKEKSPVFLIIHSLLETHPPFYAPTLKSYSFDYQDELFRLTSKENLNIFEKNALESARYLDEENEYINSLISNNTIRLYMSDHGCSLNRESRPYKEELSHIPFVIVGNGIPHIKENKLFNLQKFYEVINYVITLENYEKIFEDYLQINGIDLYNNNYIEGLIDVDLVEFGIQYIGIRTLKDIYIYRATGEECYYILPNENDNLINCGTYIKRINYLKLLMKKEMIDITKVDKFKSSRRMYDKIGKSIKLI